MNRIIGNIPCIPIPKPRPRLGRNGVYTPRESVVFEDFLAWSLRNVVGDSFIPVDQPIAVSCVFYMPMPVSWSAKKTNLMLDQFHTQRPDVDNLQKHVFDAMKKANMFKDDSFICSEYGEKRWCMPKDSRIHIAFFWGPMARYDMIEYLHKRR